MNVVYVTHNAVGSALVRSQVLPYLRGLLGRGHRVRLVTFERGEAFPDGEFPRELWTGLRPRRGGSLVAKLLDIARGIWTVRSIARSSRADLLHARSYLPAGICWVASRLTGTPYLFDMRGFLPEEYRDGGHWTERDIRYRALRLAESHLLRGAWEIVVLTRAAERRLRSEDRYAAARTRPITVIPCAVDLARFRPGTRDADPTLVYSGSLGMWYLFDEMLAVYARARRTEPRLRFLVLNRGEHDLVALAIARAGLRDAPIELRSVDFAGMPAQVARGHVAIALLRRVPSKIGSSPIKIAEYLACGLPTVVNEGLGDIDEEIEATGAGHVMPALDESALEDAGTAVARLATDTAARERARTLAEEAYAVDLGVDRYYDIYRRAVRLSCRIDD